MVAPSPPSLAAGGEDVRPRAGAGAKERAHGIAEAAGTVAVDHAQPALV